MIKYKVNLKFKDDGKSLNESIIHILKFELQKKLDMTCNILKRELPYERTHYSQIERSNN